MMSSQFSDPPSPLPFQRLLFCTWGENWVYAMPFIAFVLRKFSCRNCFSWIGNRVGSRKMTAQCEERHIQLPQEQKLYSLMLFLCWSEPFRCWQQNFQLRLNLLPLSLDNTWMCSAGFWWGMNQDSICRTASVSGPGALGVGSCTVLTAVNSLHLVTNKLCSSGPKDEERGSLGDWSCCSLLSQRPVWLCLVNGVTLCESLDTF